MQFLFAAFVVLLSHFAHALPGNNLAFCKDSQADMTELLFQGIIEHDIDQVECAIGAGARLNFRSTLHNGRTPLIEAVMTENQIIVGVLIDAGARVNGKDSFGNNPLITAVKLKNLHIVHELLSVPDINVNIKNAMGQSVLMQAILSNSTYIVERLLRAGADLKDVWRGMTPLMAAREMNNQDMMLVVLKYDADIRNAVRLGHYAAEVPRKSFTSKLDTAFDLPERPDPSKKDYSMKR